MTDENGEPEVRVIESDSLWERFYAVFFRAPFIIAAVIGALLLAVVIAVVVVLTSEFGMMVLCFAGAEVGWAG